MKPALSVVAFTVLSGAGLGALALLALYDVAATLGVTTSTASGVFFARGAVTAVAFVVAGLSSSTLHLANPRNAWRSLTRWRTSWLSREALAALVLLPIAAIWIAAAHFGLATAVRASAAAATVGLAWVTLYCTSMIYASLVPIRQWHTRRVPVAYFALGHASGALIVVGIASSHGEQASVLAALAGVLLAIAALVKLEYYTYIASDRDRVTLEQAIGVPDGVRPGRAAAKGSIMRAAARRGPFARQFPDARVPVFAAGGTTDCAAAAVLDSGRRDPGHLVSVRLPRMARRCRSLRDLPRGHRRGALALFRRSAPYGAALSWRSDDLTGSP